MRIGPWMRKGGASGGWVEGVGGFAVTFCDDAQDS